MLGLQLCLVFCGYWGQKGSKITSLLSVQGQGLCMVLAESSETLGAMLPEAQNLLQSVLSMGEFYSLPNT